MLTVKEAAARACVSESLIYAWCQSGALPHFRLGLPGKRGKIAIEVEDLDATLASFKVGRREPEPQKSPARRKSAFQHLKFR